MRLSHLFTKTQRNYPKDEISKNAQLLIRGGFIYKEMAGVYDLLPLGLRVVKKIMNIVRKEMDEIGGQEVSMTALQNKSLWEKTGRWSDKEVNIWFKSHLKDSKEIGLSWSHEEPMTRMIKQFLSSYADLPIYVYQFQTKFRNELRSKSGILRGREFLMKDLYSFNATEEKLDEFYEKVKGAYFKIFKKVGLKDKTFLTFASGGAFSKYSHEFQTICEVGEDIIYLDEEKKIAVNKEIYSPRILKELELREKKLKKLRAIEVGNIFKLGTRYSKALNLTYINKKGEEKLVVMGSYGIGIGRLMGTVVELFSDEKGIIWPLSISPYLVHLIVLKGGDKKLFERSEKIYNTLTQLKVEVLYDDREKSPGEKLKDADLIGLPIRLIISDKTGEKIEWKERNKENTILLTPDEVIKRIKLYEKNSNSYLG